MSGKKFFLNDDHAFFWGIPAFLWQILFFYIPITFLISTSFIKYFPSIQSSAFTLDYYKELLSPLYFTIIFRSLFTALTTVAVCLVISYPVAYYLTVKFKKWKALFFALLVLPFWTNFLLLVYSWYFILEHDGLINNLLIAMHIIDVPLSMMHTKIAVYCAMFYCYLPFMLLPIYSSLEKLDLKLLEASYDLGANPWTTFKKITIPLTMPGIKTGALLVFIPSFAEFVIPELLGGDKTFYVGSVITHYFLTMRDVARGSAFTIITVLFLLLFFVFLSFLYFLFCSMKRNLND